MVYKIQPDYIFLRENTYYYSRKIPADIQHHYTSKRIVQSLRTTSHRRATQASKLLSSRLEDFWLGLRMKQLEVPAAHMLRSNAKVNLSSSLPTISEALDVYLKTKGEDKNKNFFTHTNRVIGYVIQCLGERCIDQYTTLDAANFREWLKDKGLKPSSVKRIFSTIRAVINLTISEHGLDCKNAFSGIYLAYEAGKSEGL
jgi:uncharacterized protein with NAD-binding domain and iron-sulfur cluster